MTETVTCVDVKQKKNPTQISLQFQGCVDGFLMNIKNLFEMNHISTTNYLMLLTSHMYKLNCITQSTVITRELQVIFRFEKKKPIHHALR